VAEQQTRTGADGPVDPEDLAAAHGQDPDRPEVVERFARRLDEQGQEAAVQDAVSDERVRANDVGRTQSTGHPSVENP
jgi:limonene-1,2-epoxide hydrolase